jgi:hypothetical protein
MMYVKFGNNGKKRTGPHFNLRRWKHDTDIAGWPEGA